MQFLNRFRNHANIHAYFIYKKKKSMEHNKGLLFDTDGWMWFSVAPTTELANKLFNSF